jgi:hypothetical protein
MTITIAMSVLLPLGLLFAYPRHRLTVNTYVAGCVQVSFSVHVIWVGQCLRVLNAKLALPSFRVLPYCPCLLANTNSVEVSSIWI